MALKNIAAGKKRKRKRKKLREKRKEIASPPNPLSQREGEQSLPLSPAFGRQASALKIVNNNP